MQNNLNQTLQNKYPHLEVSVLKLSEVQKDNESKRIDSEFFKKEHLENETLIESNKRIVDYLDRNIKNIKSLNLNKNFNYLQISDIDLANGLEYLTTEIPYNEIPDRATYILQKNDICISTVRPNRNAVALITKPKRLVGTSGFCVLRIKDNRILPEILYIFVKTNFFITKMMRANTASLYPAVLDSDIFKCCIPIFPQDFQLEIEKMVKDSHKALEQSKVLYKEAENLLYEELGLNPSNPLESILNFNASIVSNIEKQSSQLTPNISIRTLKESFLKTGRLDAEYYQEKYTKNENLLHSFPCHTLKELVDIKKSIEPGSEFYNDKTKDSLPFIRVSNLSKFGLTPSEIYLKKEDFPAQFLENLTPKKDTILLSKDGSVGIAYCVEQDLNCIMSGAILHLNIKNKLEVLPQYLSLVLNSIVVNLQADRDCGGSIISHW